jgi:hypothetical protein
VRLPPAEVIRPKSLAFIAVTGLFQFRLFSTLKKSPR